MSALAPMLPDYRGRCTTGIVPSLTWGTPGPVLPDAVVAQRATVQVVLDSLGWEQLGQRSSITPTLHALEGGSATTVAPSTTAAALTSISTGVPPGEHGVVGYRFPAGGAVMNALRWTSPVGDHRAVVSPSDVQPVAPLGGGPWSVVSNRQFARSAFTEAYLGDAQYYGWDHPSSIVAEARQLVEAGERLVYAYYDGLDHVAHVHGVATPHFDLELAFCDWLVETLLDQLPSGTAVVVTGDHGQIDAPDIVPIDPVVEAMVAMRSGEPRFRWLHAAPGAEVDLLDAATAAHGHHAWVRTVDEILDEHWFGPTVSTAARSRLGDVALVAHEPIGFEDPAEIHADRMIGRHGSLTSAEMLVPVLHTIT